MKLVDNCEHNNICFGELVSELRRIMSTQAFIVELLLKILEQLQNRSNTILKNKEE